MHKVIILLFSCFILTGSYAQKTGNKTNSNQTADTSFWADEIDFFSDELQPFVSQTAMETILNAVCDKTLKNYLPNGVTEQVNRLQPLTLPGTGKEKKFAVNYQTDGKGSFFTVVTLSNNSNDYKEAAAYIVSMAEKLMKHKCLYRRPNEVLKSKNGDTTVIKYSEDILYGSQDYLEWMVHLMPAPANEHYVVWVIKSIPYNTIEEQKKNAQKAKGIYDKPFCDDVMTLVNESRNGFINIRGASEKDKYSDGLIYTPTFTHRYFSKTQIREVAELDILDGGGRYTCYTYESSNYLKQTETEAKNEFNLLIKKLDACLDYATRTTENLNSFGTKGYGINYTIKNTAVKVSLSLLELAENKWTLSLQVVDKAAKFK